jgi:hypothetical protein
VNVDDGIDDRDEMGVCIEDYAAAHGLQPAFAQFIYRSAAVREGRSDAKSRQGDLDLVVYALRKYVRLALQGNPTVLILLFAAPIAALPEGRALQAMAPAIVSRQAGPRFLGYLHAQKARLLGERGQKNVRRPELEARYGFDTKYAMHMLRLGHQGVELLSTGRLTLPMAEPTRSYLKGVRVGKVGLPQVLDECAALEARLETLMTTSPLPEQPDRRAVEAWLLDTYWDTWTTRRSPADPAGALPTAPTTPAPRP